MLRSGLLLGVFAAASLTSLAGCNGLGGLAGAGLDTRYQPLTGVWNYATVATPAGGSATNDTLDIVALGAGTFNGKAVHSFRVTVGAEVLGTINHMVISSAGVETAGLEDETGTDPAETDTDDWAIRFSLEPGESETFTYSAVWGSNSGTVTYQIERLDDETVTTPAGTFNCAVFLRTVIGSTGSVGETAGNTEKSWWAADVGTVKSFSTYSDGSTFSSTLTFYGPAV